MTQPPAGTQGHDGMDDHARWAIAQHDRKRRDVDLRMARCAGRCTTCVPCDIAHQCWHDSDHEGDCTCRPDGQNPGPLIRNPL